MDRKLCAFWAEFVPAYSKYVSKQRATRTAVKGTAMAFNVEPWCVGVSEVSGSVEQCRASVGPVSADTSVRRVGSVGSSVGAVSGQCRAILTVEGCDFVKRCLSVRGGRGRDGNVDSPDPTSSQGSEYLCKAHPNP